MDCARAIVQAGIIEVAISSGPGFTSWWNALTWTTQATPRWNAQTSRRTVNAGKVKPLRRAPRPHAWKPLSPSFTTPQPVAGSSLSRGRKRPDAAASTRQWRTADPAAAQLAELFD